MLRDAQGEPGETGKPSGRAVWFHSENSLLEIIRTLSEAVSALGLDSLKRSLAQLALYVKIVGKKGQTHSLR